MTEPVSEERTISAKKIFDGRIVTLEVHEVALPNGARATREVVRHPGAVAVLAETATGRVILVEQYRYAIGRVSTEIPAGKLEPGEDPLACAKRELEEETGYKADHWEFVCRFYTSPGFADEVMYLYHATGLIPGSSRPDEDEFLRISDMSAEEVERGLDAGIFCDAKTMVALEWWLRHRRRAGK
ncbi:MAG: NUDIX hydrolase [Alicyclobacillaceae bacterium]|nr:NUDIX hydrolase [Alicyclobacillaceae bacterium]